MSETFATLARLLRERAQDLPLGSAPGDAAPYRALLERLGPGVDVPGALRGAAMRPLFLVNGLLLANRHEKAGRAFTLEVLATGLETFADYLAALSAQDTVIDDAGVEALRAEQKRFFSWVIAQMPECGMDLRGILVSLKGDALDQGTAYAIRGILEEGESALQASTLFTDDEKAMFSGVFAQEPGAWDRLQQHLVQAYALPFRAAGTP